MSQIDELIKELNELRQIKENIEWIYKPQYEADKKTILELREFIAKLQTQLKSKNEKIHR